MGNGMGKGWAGSVGWEKERREGAAVIAGAAWGGEEDGASEVGGEGLRVRFRECGGYP